MESSPGHGEERGVKMGFWRSQEMKSKKERRCEYCGKQINIDETYSREVGVVDGDLSSYGLCLFCKVAMPIIGSRGELMNTYGMVGDLIDEEYLTCPVCKSMRLDYKRSEPDKHKYMCNCRKCNHIWMVELTTDIFYKNKGGK